MSAASSSSVPVDVFTNTILRACLSSVAADGTVHSQAVYQVINDALQSSSSKVHHLAVPSGGMKVGNRDAIHLSQVQSSVDPSAPSKVRISGQVEVKELSVHFVLSALSAIGCTITLCFKGHVVVNLDTAAFPVVQYSVALDTSSGEPDWTGTAVGGNIPADFVNTLSKIFPVNTHETLREHIIHLLTEQLQKPRDRSVDLLK